jgi:hypothetical protein
MLTRLTISFSEEERRALEIISRIEFRPLREQIRYMVRVDLERRGLISPHPKPEPIFEQGINER